MSPTIGHSRAALQLEDSRTGDLDFLAGGGEMGERMRTLDWTKTPLGPRVDGLELVKALRATPRASTIISSSRSISRRSRARSPGYPL